MGASVIGEVDLESDEEELYSLVSCIVYGSSSSSSLQPYNDQ